VSNPRLRRLQLDHERLQTRFRNWSPVQITGQTGAPPEVYRVAYQLKGLYASPDRRILEREEHLAEINLSLGYPRRAPQCKMLTPVFHPNFDESSICIGDFWAASEGLDDLVIRIGRMIAYQEYNTKSPLNGLAAKWAAENAPRLPVDRREVAPPLSAPTSEPDEKIVVTLLSEDQAETTGQLRASIDVGSGPCVLENDVTSIGRNDDNLICVANPTVSGYHAEICRTSEGFVLRDLQSTNGTRIGASKIDSEALLADGDLILFGDLLARFAVADT
jgi:ubiquitin-protein ligase